MDARVFMVVYFVVFQSATALVVEIHADLFTAMDSVVPQYGCASSGYPNTSQCIPIDLVIFNKTHATLVDINTAVFPVMNPIFSDNRVTVGSDLYSS